MSTPLADIPESLRQHHQFDGDFCAVSGFEAVAKLEGLLEPAAFPFQSNPANQSKGFGENDRNAYLDRTFIGEDLFPFSGSEAVKVVAREVEAGRFPLVSLYVETVDGRRGYHIFVVAKYNGEARLINPAVPEVVTSGIRPIAQFMEARRLSQPDRNKLHIMTYKKR